VIPPPEYKETELIALVLTWGILMIIVISRRRLAMVIPAFPIFFLSFFFNFLAMLSTNAEAFWSPGSFNLAEHVFYAAGMVLFVLWLSVFFRNKRGES